MATRKYQSELREKQARETRRRILEGAGRVALFDVGRVTHAAVARTAQVSERTVWRYFPTVDELHSAFLEFQEKKFGASYPEDLSIDDLPSMFERWPERFNESLVDDFLRDRQESALVIDARSRRYARIEAAVAQLLPDATPTQVRQLALVFGALMSAQIFVRGMTMSQLDPSQIAPGPAWAMRVLIQAIRKGDTPWK